MAADSLLDRPLAAINVGADLFADALANDDAGLYAQAVALQEEEDRYLTRWIEGVLRLRSGG